MVKRRNLAYWWLLNILVLLLCSGVTSLWAADNTGKIAGTIRDKSTGEPLIGVNVAVTGTTLGASTNTDGFYYILRVPPGAQELRMSMIGYRTTTVRNVRVQADLTSEINTSLEPSTVELEEVVITAEQKLVRKDVTSTRRTVTRETIRETPGMESATDVFRLQAGTVFSAAPPSLTLADGTRLQVRDESLKDFHIRGGRGGEILYLVDGMPVTHPIYGGRSVVDLNVSDVESVELLTGAFNAEYGQAQSGVVNITTRSGGEQLKGGIEYKSDQWKALGTSYNTDYASVYLGGPEPITRYFLPSLGITIPGKMSFFGSGNLTLTDTPYDIKRPRLDIPLLWWNIRERRDNSQNFNAKLNWDITGQHRLALSYHGSWKQWSEFDWSWKEFPGNTALYKRNNAAVNVLFNHVLSKSTYYSLNFGYLGVTYRGSWNGKTPADFWAQDSTGRWVSTINEPKVDGRTGFFDQSGVDAIWRDDLTRTYTFKGDITSQAHPSHLIKAGVELRYNSISYIDISDGSTKLSRYAQDVDPFPPLGPFPEFGQNRWVFDVKPTVGAAYIQDKFELEYIILNAGFRLDWFSLGSAVMGDDWKSRWERSTGLKANWKSLMYKVSPRFGVSFPISENTVVFFSYGHFCQLPELQYFYREPYSGIYAGNPSLDYEQTILYEFGFTHQFSDYWAIDIKSYAKDITKQVNSTTVYGTEGLPVQLYDNNGYGRARGLEFELTKGYSSFLSGKASYTLQWTNGYSSSAFDDYVRSITNFPNPIRERPLDWDVRQQFIFQGTVAAPEDQHPDLFGFELPDDWNLTILFRYATGSPYTPGDATLNKVDEQKRAMTATGPSTSSTDFKFEKGFTFLGVRAALTVDVFNLFNQENVQTVSGSYGFNVWTGRPFRYGDIEKPQLNYFDYYTIQSKLNPYVLSEARTTKLGVRIDF